MGFGNRIYLLLGGFSFNHVYHILLSSHTYVYIYIYHTMHMFLRSFGKLFCYVCIAKMDLIVIYMCACSSRVGKHAPISLLTESSNRRWKSPKTRNM